MCTADVVKDYFNRSPPHKIDRTTKLKTSEVTVHETHPNQDWKVTFAHIDKKSMTGSHVAQAVRKYPGLSEHFTVIYSDGLADANLAGQFNGGFFSAGSFQKHLFADGTCALGQGPASLTFPFTVVSTPAWAPGAMVNKMKLVKSGNTLWLQ